MRTRLRALLLVLSARGVTPRWALAWVLSWCAAAALSRVAIPPVDPGAFSESRALEQLGVLGLCLPTALTALLLDDRAPWLSATAPRPSWQLRQLTPWTVVAATTVTAAAASPAFAPGVSWVRLTLLACLFSSMTVLTGTVTGTWAAVPAPLLAVVASIRGVVPWEVNAVYNAETDPLLTAVTLVTLGAALVVSGPSRGGTPWPRPARGPRPRACGRGGGRAS